VLTNCDAFEQFPPPPFGGLIVLGRRPGRLRLAMRTMRPKLLRHSILGYGGLVAKPLDPALSARWAQPCAKDRAIAVDAARFMSRINKRELVEVGDRLNRFDKPVLLLWGTADPFFKLALGERLQAAFPTARLERIDGARTFVALDEPERVAQEIAAFSAAPA
jgi:pimeloyl-ACP methyl ester carboxylesterase